MRRFLAVIVGAAVFSQVGEAAASEKWSAQFGLGPKVNLEGGGVNGTLDADFQYHFRQRQDGPALGLQVPLHFDSNEVGMHIGPIFMWHFEVAKPNNIPIYVAPLVSSGFGFTAFEGGGTIGYWFLTFGAQVKARFTEHIGAYIRPATFDVIAGPNIITGNWSSTGGLSLAF